MYPFNVRVYGILIDKEAVLVSDEYIKGKYITKFPGGGLEFGEGTAQCIVREFKEELDLDVEVISHFYTTDFFVASAFNPHAQVISIYYLVRALSAPAFKISEKVFDFGEVKEGAQSFRLIPFKEIKQSNFTFAIDKHIAELLNKN
jgi:8-oxo-dGTP diphosphatase